ncbi:MAG: RND family transporter [Holophagales bacterium]|nr:RND family transporter [Holophagales bacterium]MBK9965980.1 RND family transporter [Holophagales bacterium]
MAGKPTLTERLEHLVFGHRRLVILLFLAVTALFVWSNSRLRVDAGFTKQLPLKHPYIGTFLKHQQEFGGANRVLVALVARDGNMFTPAFFDALKKATDEVFFLPGVDRGRVQSLFTPNVRFTEVIEDGIAAGNVIPDDFETSPEGLEKVRRNILKAGIVGRLVANDFSGALISAELMEVDPTTGRKLDVIALSKLIEKNVREKFDADFVPGSPVDVHVIGFAKVIGDIAGGATRVILFFLVTFVITGLLVYFYSQSHWLSAIVLACATIAVVWQLGFITLLGFGIDPMSILVPFLVFAIAVSHGVQMVSSNGSELFDGADSLTAARNSFRRLLVPGGIALATDTIGFFTILFIRIRVIQEIAVAASLGVAAIILTNLVLLPVLLSYFRLDDSYREKLHRRARHMEKLWRRFSVVTERGPAAVIVGLAVLLGALGAWKGRQIQVGDLHRGVPELRADSRYNLDTAAITSKFSIGVDILNVIAETKPEGCVDHAVMSTIDDFSWHMANVPGVQSTVDLAGIAKMLNAGWNEGSPKWRVLSRNQSVLQQSVTYVPTTSGLLNSDCSVMPVMLFTTDHKADTIQRVVTEVKAFEARHGNPAVAFRLATGNVGVMAATNEVVDAAQYPIMACVFGSVILLCLVTYRSLRGTLCILIPLLLVSLLSYALMAMLEIGLKVSTLPVAALGVGVGVDYGIYLYSRFREFYRGGESLRESYFKTLEVTGNGVLFTGITLAIGVATWMFSPLKFQADMGLLLAFLFLMNMVGALVVLPALARFLLHDGKRHHA